MKYILYAFGVVAIAQGTIACALKSKEPCYKPCKNYENCDYDYEIYSYSPFYDYDFNYGGYYDCEDNKKCFKKYLVEEEIPCPDKYCKEKCGKYDYCKDYDDYCYKYKCNDDNCKPCKQSCKSKQCKKPCKPECDYTIDNCKTDYCYKPDYCKPDYCKPDYCKPDYCKPDCCKPDYCKPDYCKPDYCKPDYCKPDYCKPDCCKTSCDKPSKCYNYDKCEMYEKYDKCKPEKYCKPEKCSSECKPKSCKPSCNSGKTVTVLINDNCGCCEDTLSCIPPPTCKPPQPPCKPTCCEKKIIEEECCFPTTKPSYLNYYYMYPNTKYPSYYPTNLCDVCC